MRRHRDAPGAGTARSILAAISLSATARPAM
jgi:hypothetical protein